FLHMTSDAAVSAGGGVAAALLLLTRAHLIDPLVSLVIFVIIVLGKWGLLRGFIRMSLCAGPPGVDSGYGGAYLEGLAGVAELHDLHIWPMSTTETALTCHLVIPSGHPGDAFLMATAQELEHRFGIGHTTIQIETSRGETCALSSDQVV